jgi:hypothetical protein
MAAGLYGGIMGGVGIGVGVGAGLPMATAVGSVLLGTAFPLGVLALSYLGTKEIYRAVVKRRRRAVNRLMERVTAEVTACIAAASLEASEAPEQLPGG